MDKLNAICVFCGSSMGNNEEIVQQASELGNTLAKQEISLIYGGAKIGIMGKVADGVLDAGGKVIGIIPEFLKQKEIVHLGLTELITTKDMHERKMKMQEMSNGFITLPGGFGTLEELFEAVTWAQLDLHKKPIGILNIGGYYDHLIALLHTMVDTGFLKKEHIDLLVVEQDIEMLLQKMNTSN